MPTMRQRKINYLVRQGFFASEAVELSRTSRAGMKASYFRFFIRSRRRTLDNSKTNNWSEKRYRDFIRQKYIDIGALKPDSLGRMRVDVWAMLRAFEEKARMREDEYESPWRRKGRRKTAKKKQTKRITRKDMIKSFIKKINRQMDRTRDPEKQDELLGKRQEYQRRLDGMENG